MALPTTANVSRPKSLGYGLRLNSNYFRLATVDPVDVVTADLQAPRVNTATNAEDFRNEFGELFSRADFTGGEGLAYAHRRNQPDNAGTRFWDSEHIDISNPDPGQAPRISLLYTTAIIEASAQSNGYLAYDGTAIYMGEGNVTRRSADFTVASPSFADSDPGSATALLGLASVGTDVYSCHTTNGIYRRTAGSWAVLASTVTALRIWPAKNQLIASVTAPGTTLQTVNLTSGAAITTLATLSIGQSWLDVRDCGIAILGCASDGKLYAFANNASAVLELKSQTPMPGSEVPYCVGHDGTYVFIGTREATASGAIGRVYRATLTEGFSLEDLQLLRQWGNQSTSIDQAPRRIVAHQKGVVWGIYEDRSTDKSSIWRYDSASGGVSRNLDSKVTGLVLDILPLAGRLFFSVNASGLIREKVGTYETDGYLIGPLGDFFNASEKSWAGAFLDHEAISSDESLRLYYATTHAALTDESSSSWVLAKTVLTGTDTAETTIEGVDARLLAGKITLTASTDLATSPKAAGFTFRAYPGPGDVEITFHVNTSDWLIRPGKTPRKIPGLGQQFYDALKNIEGRFAECEPLFLDERFLGVVKKVGSRLPVMSERGASTVATTVTFTGRRAPMSGADVSSAAMGIAEMGITPMGGVEAA